MADTSTLGNPIAGAGCLSTWLLGDGAVAIQELLSAFGMNARESRLVPRAEFRDYLFSLDPGVVDWVAGFVLPLSAAPSEVVNPATGKTLSSELRLLYDAFARPCSVTNSGGFVAASKAMHCLFPELAPMIDGKHSGISYYNVVPGTYAPPLGVGSWENWVGTPIVGVVNPSPRGAGRCAWRSQ